MKIKMLSLLLAVSLLLSGCGFYDGSYAHVTPYQEPEEEEKTEVVSASDYRQLRRVLESMVGQGVESGVINVADYDQELVEKNMNAVAIHIRENYPVGAYAVEAVEYEVGTSSGRPAIAVNIRYRHGRIEIQRIRKISGMETAAAQVGVALENCESGLVLEVEEFRNTDFSQIVEDYAEQHPDRVMETPQVAEAVYGSGTSRVVELTFTYQTNREALRTMQNQVEPVFDSATLYVSGEGAPYQKYSQLYGFLMERFDYSLETSITPTYSLLCHGVGDSRAFAVVYGAMCRQAGLECMVVTGTKDGAPWVWNMIQVNGQYFHVDLLRSSLSGGFREYVDREMVGYVWDYSAFPECVEPPVQTTVKENIPEETENPSEETLPVEETEPATEETVPTETVPEESTENMENS